MPGLRVARFAPGFAFPVGIDQGEPANPVPLTLQACGLRGTPSLVVFDPSGGVRLSHFGQIGDLQLGAVIGQLLVEPWLGHEPPASNGVSAPSTRR